MERFCDKCGTLVSGEGTFCPQCGAPLPGAVNLTKPSGSDMMGTVTPGVDNVLAPGQHPETDEYFTGAGDHFAGDSVNLGGAPASTPTMGSVSPSAPVPPVTPVPPVSPAPASQPNMNYQQYGSSPAPTTGGSYGTMPNYPQNTNVNYNNTQEMSVGQWVGTYLLSTCLGIVSLILLFVWSFGDTPQPKKNFARAVLIVQAVIVGLYIIFMIGMIACTGSFLGADFWDEIMY